MRTTLLVHTKTFRFLAPIFMGIIAYFLILLGFDSISKLKDNFLSIEIMVCIALAYIVIELLRVSITFFRRKILVANILSRWEIPLQMLVSVIITAIIVSVSISFYYHFLIGFSSFKTELAIFNGIYIFIALAYNMLYISLIYLGKSNEVAIEAEIKQNESIENELKEYVSRINPSFLFTSLQRVLVHLKVNPPRAVSTIHSLSNIYRYILLSRGSNLSAINEEIDQVNELVAIYNEPGSEGLKVIFEDSNSGAKIVKGTLHTIVMYLISIYITDSVHPLLVHCYIKQNNLHIKANGLLRLIPLDFSQTELEVINRAYKFYNVNEVELVQTENETVGRVHLIVVDE